MRDRIIAKNYMNTSLLKDGIRWIECLLKEESVDDEILIHLVNTCWHALSVKTDSELINQLICVRLLLLYVN